MITLSIIIPIYNTERYLADCLQSVIGIEDTEIILVNDCTPDNSMIVAQSYLDNYNNFKLITHSKNRGLGSARNSGIENATAKYVMFLDSDDYLDTKKLIPLVSRLKVIEDEQVIVSFLRFDEEKGIWPETYTKFYTKYNEKRLNGTNFKQLIRLLNISPLRIIKREKIISDGIKFPNGYYEDVMWSYWFAYSCKSTLILNTRIYYYRRHKRSILSSSSCQHMELIQQQERTLDLFQSKSAPPKTFMILRKQFIKHAKHVLFKTERIPAELRQDFYEQTIEKHTLSINNQLDEAFKRLASVTFAKNPIEKIKRYKKLMSQYHSIKRDSK